MKKVVLGFFEVKVLKSSSHQGLSSTHRGMEDMLFSHLYPNPASINNFHS